MCWQVIRQLWIPDGSHVHLLLSVCQLCPERCRSTPALPALGVRIDQALEWRNACPAHTKNQSLLFSSIQRPPVICNEYKALIVAHKTRALSPHFCVSSLVHHDGRGHVQTHRIFGVNHFTVALQWKKNGSWFVRVCLPSCLLSLEVPWERDLRSCTFHRTVKFIISSVV